MYWILYIKHGFNILEKHNQLSLISHNTRLANIIIAWPIKPGYSTAEGHSFLT